MYTCVISVFGRGANEIFTLLGCYTALISKLPVFRDNLLVPSPRVKLLGHWRRNQQVVPKHQ